MLSMQLPPDEVSELIVLKNIFWQILCAFDHADAVLTSALTLKSLVHVPLGGWIKEGELLSALMGLTAIKCFLVVSKKAFGLQLWLMHSRYSG